MVNEENLTYLVMLNFEQINAKFSTSGKYKIFLKRFFFSLETLVISLLHSPSILAQFKTNTELPTKDETEKTTGNS